MKPYILHRGDCIEVMRGMADNSVDAVVTDPPYGISFMGKAWDGADIVARTERRRAAASHAPNAGPNGGHKSIAAEAGKYDLTPAAMRAFQDFSEEWAREAFRVLKPGGYLLSFSSARTYHRMTSGIEDAGFEIRDQLLWLYGSGFPKSHNLDGDHEGWGTALKPAHEPICMARKPLAKGNTVAANVLAFGTGAINIDGCRVETADNLNGGTYSPGGKAAPMPGDERTGAALGMFAPGARPATDFVQPDGRWPANLIHDGSAEVRAMFPDAKGQQGDLNETGRDRPSSGRFGDMAPPLAHKARIEDDKSAARFFYCAKASRADRNAGLVNPGPQFEHGATLRKIEDAPKTGNIHPTVKPTDLMAYLCRLVTPPGGVVLDPFMGSGSTGKAAMREGFQFIGIDLSEEYFPIAQARIEHELAAVAEANKPPAPVPQLDMFSEQVGVGAA